MKRVYEATNPIEAEMMKDLLESAGIPAVVQGDFLYGLRGGVPMATDTLPSVWVIEDADFEPATRLVSEQSGQLSEAALSTAMWSCSECGESVDAEFESCWNCQALRPEGA